MCNPVIFLMVNNCYFILRPNFWSHCFNSPESKAEARYVSEYIDGLITFSKKYISRVVIKFHVKHIW